METCQDVALNEDVETVPSADVGSVLMNGIMEEKQKSTEATDLTEEMDERKVNIDERTVNIDEHKVNIDERKVNIDEQKVNIDEQKVNIDECKVKIDERKVNTDERKVNIDERKVHTDERKVNIDERKVHTDERKVNTDERKVNIDERKVNIDEHKVNIDEHKVNIDEHKVNIDEHKVNIDERKVNIKERKVNIDELTVNIDDMTLLDNDAGLGSPKINEALTDELKFELKTVLSNHFSHECLSKDKFLRTQMDYDQFIPISIVAELEDVRKIMESLTLQSKMDAIIKTLQEIKFVQLSDGNEKVRRVIERSTLMLREIPASVSEKEIRGIFTGDGCPPMISCEYVVNDNWYVHFGSEDDANRAYRFVKETKKTFLDKPIMARFKGKSALTGSYILQNSENGPVCPPQAAASAAAQAPSLVQPTTASTYLGYFPSSYGYGFAEQPLGPYYSADCNPFVRAFPSACPIGSCAAAVMPFNCYYPTTGDHHQTTVELINARQRKPHPRFGGSSSSSGYYGRSEQAMHDHKQPPRFNRKRSEGGGGAGGVPADSDTHQPTMADDIPNASANRLTARHEATGNGHMSHVTGGDNKPSAGGRYGGPRRGGGGGGGGGGRGRRNNRWNQESGNVGPNAKRRGSDGGGGGGGGKTASFELETSSFPPLSSAKTNVIPAPVAIATTCDANIQATPPLPTESPVSSNRVDQSTTTDASDLDGMSLVVLPDPAPHPPHPVAASSSSPKEPIPSSTSKFSYAQIAKRLKEPQTTTGDAPSPANPPPQSTSSKSDAQPPPSSTGKQPLEGRNETKGKASSQTPPSSVAKKEESGKEWRNYHSRNRPQRPPPARAQPDYGGSASKERV